MKEKDAAERMAHLEAKLASLPPSPGCYLFIGEKGEALYVGKAKSLRSRVRSYFQDSNSDSRYFIPLLRRWCFDLETVVTANEKEAAVLENQLIKKHKPRFNVKLRDDKEFLCIRLDDKRAWPRLETVRKPQPDRAKYFGPYHSASSARRTLHLVNKHFQLRTCSDADFASRKRPCLQHQIKRCLAPCVLEVDREAYGAQVRAVGLFLEGRHDELTRELEDLMRASAAAMEFERAAIYRDQLRAVTAIHEAQRVAAVSDVDQDVVGVYREGGNVEIEVIFVRAGRVADTVSFSLRRVELPDEEVLAGFISEYYAGDEGSALIPAEVLVPVLPEGAEGVAEWLSERRGRKVQLLVPQRGARKKLLDMAAENAKHAYREKQRAMEDVEARLEELRERLRLPSLPRRIECCDISHLGGNDTVGAIVALHDGALDKKRYRSFHVRGVAGGDDYAAMAEVLSRRFRRGKAARDRGEASAESNETRGTPVAVGGDGVLVASEPTPSERSSGREADWDLPDLFVVDGGRGQLGVALAAARDLGLHDLAIVGLAKERENVAGETVVDRVYLPGQKNGIPLRASSSALFFLARARDEAHRFANAARKKLGGARQMRSELDELPGIGDRTKKALLRHLGSVRAVREASDEALLAVPGVNRRHLAALRKGLLAPPTDDADLEMLAQPEVAIADRALAGADERHRQEADAPPPPRADEPRQGAHEPGRPESDASPRPPGDASASTPPRALHKMRRVSYLGVLGPVRLAAIAGVLVAGGVGAALVAQPPPPPPPAAMPPVEVRVAGEVLPAAGDTLGNALDLVRRYARGTMKLRLPGGREVELRRADLGLTIDRVRLAEFVTAAIAPDGVVRRAHVAHNPDQPLEVPLPLAIDEALALARLVDLKAESDVHPQDARIDLDARKVEPEIVGHRLDVYASLARIEEAIRDGRDVVDLVAQHDAPRVVAASLAGVKFDHVLGWFETRYTPGRKYEDRTYNLRLAASKLDGRVIMPGETFDFNEVVGPRDEANGYRVAKVIAQGELVDGLGGGTCQISGTLHAAVMFAGLEVVGRYPHSRPSTYIKLGLDATVAYPSITYRFRNNLDFPVVLHEKVAGGVVRAEVLGPERKQTVSYFRRIDEVLPFEELERETDKLPKGERVVTQRGIPGFRATSSRVVRDGAYAERTKWTEKYPPTNQIVAVGTGPEDMKPRLAEDNHPEYTVDEVLVMTQGPGIRTPGVAADERGGGMIEQRTPGKTGEAGWIEKLGLARTRVGNEGDSSDERDGDAPSSGDPPTSGDTTAEAKKADDAKGDGRDRKGRAKKDDKDKKAKKSAKKPKEGEG